MTNMSMSLDLVARRIIWFILVTFVLLLVCDTQMSNQKLDFKAVETLSTQLISNQLVKNHSESKQLSLAAHGHLEQYPLSH